MIFIATKSIRILALLLLSSVLYLYSIVPTGKYMLRLDIEIVDGSEPSWVRSNQVSVEISVKM